MQEVTGGEFDKNKWNLTYIPHGIDTELFKPIDKDDKTLIDFKREYYGDKFEQFKYKILFNSRNAWRKNPSNLMWAYNKFVESLPTQEEKEQCLLILHTEVVDQVGTDLDALRSDLYPNVNIMFSKKKIKPEHMVYLYNSVDATICPSSAEGFGLSFAESVMCGTPTIATITGGLQDQMNIRYKNDLNKNYMSEDIWLGIKNGENQIISHGEWCIPLMPETRVMKGSPQTPYIYEDYYSNDELCNAIYKMYKYENKKERGLKGREWKM